MTTPDGFQVNVEDTAARRRPVTWVYDRQRLGAASGRHGAALFWRRGGFDRQVVMGRSWARPPERSQMTTARTADRGESAAPNPGELIAGVDVVSSRSSRPSFRFSLSWRSPTDAQRAGCPLNVPRSSGGASITPTWSTMQRRAGSSVGVLPPTPSTRSIAMRRRRCRSMTSLRRVVFIDDASEVMMSSRPPAYEPQHTDQPVEDRVARVFIPHGDRLIRQR